MNNIKVNEVIRKLEDIINDCKEYVINNRIETRSELYELIENNLIGCLRKNIDTTCFYFTGMPYGQRNTKDKELTIWNNSEVLFKIRYTINTEKDNNSFWNKWLIKSVIFNQNTDILDLTIDEIIAKKKQQKEDQLNKERNEIYPKRKETAIKELQKIIDLIKENKEIDLYNLEWVVKYYNKSLEVINNK